MTNDAVIPRLLEPSRKEDTLQQRYNKREPLIREFLQGDPIYEQLDQQDRKLVEDSIQEELQKMDRGWVIMDLMRDVPLLLEEMLGYAKAGGPKPKEAKQPPFREREQQRRDANDRGKGREFGPLSS